MTATRPAVFVDRDGTLVEPRHYPSTPEELRIYDGVTEELHRIQRAGFLLVVVTNQSGLAHGYFSAEDLERMHNHLRQQLGRGGVTIDAIYHCPHHIEGVNPELAVECDCRKPRPGMLLQAAADLNVDLSRSWFVGDILDDVEAGNRAGCRTILVDLGTELAPESVLREPDFTARSTVHALRIVQASTGARTGVETSFVPASWLS